MTRTADDTWDLGYLPPAARDLPPFDEEDTAGFADMRYVSGTYGADR